MTPQNVMIPLDSVTLWISGGFRAADFVLSKEHIPGKMCDKKSEGILTYASDLNPHERDLQEIIQVSSNS